MGKDDPKNTGGKGGPLPPATRSASVTPGQLQEELESFREEISKALTLNITNTINATLTNSIATLKDSFDLKVNDLQESVKSLQYEFDSYKAISDSNILALKKRIFELENFTKAQVIYNNTKEQRGRNRTFRLHGRKTAKFNSRQSMKDTYDLVILPAFEKAVIAGDLESVPTLRECGEYGHPLKARDDGSVPSIIFKFISRHLFNIFLHHSRDVTDELNKSLPDSNKLRVGRDLSYLNRKTMSTLFRHNMVKNCRLSGTVVQYCLKSDEQVWIPVLIFWPT